MARPRTPHWIAIPRDFRGSRHGHALAILLAVAVMGAALLRPNSATVVVAGAGTAQPPAAAPNTVHLPTIAQVPADLFTLFQRAGEKHQISPQLIAAIFWMEHGHTFPTTGPWASSPVGASGPFQFLPSSWVGFGDDCDGDGVKDIQNLADAACGAARHLHQAQGALGTSAEDQAKIRAAAFSYNHADWYAAGVLSKYLELREETAR